MQEVLQRLRQQRQSRLSHSQHEIEGILECSADQGGELSESGAEDGEPAAAEPRAGPALPDQAGPADVDMPDLEDMGQLAQHLEEAGTLPGHMPLPPGLYSLTNHCLVSFAGPCLTWQPL